MSNIIGTSRNSIMIKKGIKYIRRLDLECNNVCDIVIEINPKSAKPILVIGSCREWQQHKKLNIQNSRSQGNQLNRLKITMSL